jgi:hypothetical protein
MSEENISQSASKSSAFNCPHCGSDQTQKLSVIFQSGTSNIQTESSSLGTGLTGFGRGQQGIIVGSTTTKGVQQTHLAISAAPPAQKSSPIGSCCGCSALWLVVLVIWFGSCMDAKSGLTFFWCVGGGLTGLGLIGTIGIVIQDNKYNREVWPGLKVAWDASWLCHRCGDKFSTLPPPPPPPTATQRKPFRRTPPKPR